MSRAALLLASTAVVGCAAEALRTDQCALVESAEQEACLREARDPKWGAEEKRRERVEAAATPEEERKLECEALREPDLGACLRKTRGTDDR